MLGASDRQTARREVIRQLLPTEVSRVEQMPKVELHLHLEGSIRAATMLRLAERHGVDLGAADEDELLERYEFEDFDQFAKLFMLGLSVLRSGEDFELVIEQLADELIDQNVLHAEITTTPWNHLHRGIAAADYSAALDAGRIAAAAKGLSIVWVCDIPRGFEDSPYEQTLDYVLGPLAPKGLAAFGLGGTEVGHPCEDFTAPFERALAAGLHSNPHAGETQGPESVRAALECLKAERIGHGVRSIEDAELVSELAERRTPLEVCPTSNVALGVVPDYQHHQLREMLEAGLNVSVNSDDPAYFSTTLTEELLVAMAFAGCSAGDIARLQSNAADAAFLTGDERRALRDRVEAG